MAYKIIPHIQISKSNPSYLTPNIISGGVYSKFSKGVSKNSAPKANVGLSELTPVKYKLLLPKFIIFIISFFFDENNIFSNLKFLWQTPI